MKPDLNTPLDDAELHRLDDILLDSGLDAPMDIAMLDGYLCALFCAPRALEPARWMPWVWDFERGEQVPQFSSPKDAKAAAALVMRFAHEIGQTLAEASDEFEPLFPVTSEEEDAEPAVADWCAGFLKGTELDPEVWPVIEASHADWFAALRRFGTEEGWQALDELAEKDPERLPDFHAVAATLTRGLRRVHGFERAAREPWRQVLGPQDAPRREAPPAGRNDPCPCGSGKKYKQCHGRGA
jgi:uncharacterized protein